MNNMRLIDADEFASNLKRISELKPNGIDAGKDASISIDMLINHLKSMPSINPVRQGHWMHEISKGKPEWDICPFCGKTIMHADDHHYCMRCGAKLEEKDETEQEDTEAEP